MHDAITRACRLARGRGYQHARRPKVEPVLSEDEQLQLTPIVHSHSIPESNAFFIEKLRDLADLYLMPPGKLWCLDEKSQCKALERTQSMLPTSLRFARLPYGRQIGTLFSIASSVLF